MRQEKSHTDVYCDYTDCLNCVTAPFRLGQTREITEYIRGMGWRVIENGLAETTDYCGEHPMFEPVRIEEEDMVLFA